MKPQRKTFLSGLLHSFGEGLGSSLIYVPVICFLWWLWGMPSFEDFVAAITAGLYIAGTTMGSFLNEEVFGQRGVHGTRFADDRIRPQLGHVWGVVGLDRALHLDNHITCFSGPSCDDNHHR